MLEQLSGSNLMQMFRTANQQQCIPKFCFDIERTVTIAECEVKTIPLTGNPCPFTADQVKAALLALLKTLEFKEKQDCAGDCACVLTNTFENSQSFLIEAEIFVTQGGAIVGSADQADCKITIKARFKITTKGFIGDCQPIVLFGPGGLLQPKAVR